MPSYKPIMARPPRGILDFWLDNIVDMSNKQNWGFYAGYRAILREFSEIGDIRIFLDCADTVILKWGDGWGSCQGENVNIQLKLTQFFESSIEHLF